MKPEVVAMPFPKFFNYHEWIPSPHDEPVHDVPTARNDPPGYEPSDAMNRFSWEDS